MLRLVAPVLATLAVASSSPAAADCAMYGLIPTPLTPDGTVLPPDGGILIGAIADLKGTLDKGDPTLTAYQWKGGATMKARSLAPGLSVLPAQTSTVVVDAAGKQVLVVKHTNDKHKKLEVPKVSGVTHEKKLSRRNVERLLVAFDHVPIEAVAIVISDATGKPRSWGRIEPVPPTASPAKPIQIAGFASHDCKALPNGTVPSKAGDAVIVQFVDGLGRLSPATKPFKVTTAAP